MFYRNKRYDIFYMVWDYYDGWVQRNEKIRKKSSSKKTKENHSNERFEPITYKSSDIFRAWIIFYTDCYNIEKYL
jgi:hypothetical protein